MKSCEGCDHTPADCLSCEAQIFNGWDADITLLDEWARVARRREMRERSDRLIMCADFLAGLVYCRTLEKMQIMADVLGGLRDDARTRSIRERFRTARISALTEISR